MNRPHTQGVFGFEQEAKDAQLAADNARLQAKLSAQVQRAIQKRQAELDKAARRRQREAKRREKLPNQVALCGISFFSRSPLERARGSYWQTCRHCGKTLTYYDSYEEAQSNLRDCKRD